MKILKNIGLAIVLFLAALLAVALFIPRTYTVSVSETINQPRQKVFDYVRMLNNQTQYSVWVMADPNLNPVITGIDGTVGAIQKWNSKIDDVGEGEQEITALTPERMDLEIRFKRPFAGTSKAANIFKSVSENQTLLTSEFYSNDSYPLNLPSYIFARKMIEKAQVKNLKNIKRILEQEQIK